MGYNMFRTKKFATENIKASRELLIKNLEHIAAETGYETFEVIRVGRFIEGQAYYHEVDEFYTCVGFEAEIETSIDFGDQGISDPTRDVGFYSIWIGRAHSAAPFTFEESYRPFGDCDRFENGLGDRFEVRKVLASVNDVSRAILEK